MTSETPENPENPEGPEASSDASSEASTEVSTEVSAEAGPGLRASLEAILLVADEPVPVVVLAQVLERPRNEVRPNCATWPRPTSPRAAASTCARSPAAGGSTLVRIARHWSSVSSVTGRRSG